MKTKNNWFIAILGAIAVCAMSTALVGCGQKGEQAPVPENINQKFKPGDPPPPPMKNGKPVEGVSGATQAPPMDGTSASQNIPQKK